MDDKIDITVIDDGNGVWELRLPYAQKISQDVYALIEEADIKKVG